MKVLYFTSNVSSISDPICHTLVAYLSQRLKIPVQYLEVDGSRRVEILTNQEPHIAWICGLLHVVLTRQLMWRYQPIAAPVMSGKRYQRQPIYFGDVIVHRESNLFALNDLQGKCWGVNEKSSFSGYHMMRTWLNQNKLSAQFFGSHVVTGSHLKSITAVVRKEVDFATIDSIALDMFQKQYPDEFNEIRTIFTLGPYPAPPMIVTNKCPSELVVQIQTAVVQLHELPSVKSAFEKSNMAFFAPVSLNHCHPIQALNIHLV